jgi:TM2 domain-containing membrane protein YozV
LDEKRIQPTTMAWKKGMDGWKRISTLPDFQAHIAPQEEPPLPPEASAPQQPPVKMPSQPRPATQAPQQPPQSAAPTTALAHQPKKKCPYCAEEILAEAIKCKHCGSNLNQVSQAAPRNPTAMQPAALPPGHYPSNYTAPRDSQVQVVSLPPKSPGLAVILSLVIIGTGQFYNGDIGKGIVMLLMAIILVPITAGVLWLPIAIWSAVDAYSSAKNPAKRW